ncbi:MAG: pyridoxal phosphate-dependent aminotransferase [Vicinamibacterales bacterium]
MSVSRRNFLRAVGAGGAGVAAGAFAGTEGTWLPARWLVHDAALAADAGPLLLHNNENPLGPGDAAIEAITAALADGGWRAGRYDTKVWDLVNAIMAKYGVKRENVAVGCGSTQLLRSAVQVFTSRSRPLVTGSPSYEECPDYARLIGTPLRAVPLDRTLCLDLDAMAAASLGAGMVFLNNPNNPTATVHGADAMSRFIQTVLDRSPETVVAIDEAYHDYVTDPSHQTQIPAALSRRNVLVVRTFSKAYGMAGLRVGYAIGHPETIRPLAQWEGAGSINLLGAVAAAASIKDETRLRRESVRNTEARRFTIDWFDKAGFRATDSQTNFIFVDLQRPAREFRDGCRAHGVVVGRDFPPFEKTHARISIGTIEEMRRAVEVFGKVLHVQATAVA